jgi:hypothetical protein
MAEREFRIGITIPEEVLKTTEHDEICEHINSEIASLLPVIESEDVGDIDINWHWHTYD